MAFVSGISVQSLSSSVAVTKSISAHPVRAASKALKMTQAPEKTTTKKQAKEGSFWNVNPSGEGLFGFTSFAETWNGRMSMLGLTAALGTEAVSGQSLLEQVGITNQSEGYVLLIVLAGLWTMTSLGYVTLKRASTMDAQVSKPKGGENF